MEYSIFQFPKVLSIVLQIVDTQLSGVNIALFAQVLSNISVIFKNQYGVCLVGRIPCYKSYTIFFWIAESLGYLICSF